MSDDNCPYCCSSKGYYGAKCPACGGATVSACRSCGKLMCGHNAD